MKFPLSDYLPICELIQTMTGLKVDDKRLDDLARAADDIMASLTLPGINSLMLLLSQRPVSEPVWKQIISRVAIGETYFFRNRDQFLALQNTVLPQLIAQKRQIGCKSLRLWSAGCSTGEEPYSLAILLRELLPDINEWAITILGSDLNVNSLEYARRGLYTEYSFRLETRDDIKDKWFETQEKYYELDPAVRRMVTFTPLNLISDDYPCIEKGIAHFDLVVCRNVTIYFQLADTRQVVRKFFDSLNPGGWLVVGHAEPTATVYGDFEVRNFENAIFYQKPETPVSPPFIPKPVEVKPPVAPTRVKPPHKPQPEPDYTAILQQVKQAADRENWSAALQLLSSIERDARTKTHPYTHYLRGLILLHADDTDGAFQALRRAVYCDPNFALAHYLLGELYEKRGDFYNAERNWRRAQHSLGSLDSQQALPFSDDLSVEMFHDLLDYRLKTLMDHKIIS